MSAPAYWTASYVRHTSLHLPITRFSHLPLKFFFLISSIPSGRDALPFSQKHSPKTKSGDFWGIWAFDFGKTKMGTGLQSPYLSMFSDFSHFPKNALSQFHYVAGQWRLASKRQNCLATLLG